MMLKVYVTPAAKRESIEEKPDGTLAIAVKEPAERNLANTRVREVVAKHLALPVGKVRILTGHRARSKIVSISD